jgi:hypothetical protein
MYRVVMDRERWFSVIMGEDYKVDVRTTEKLANRVPFPNAAARGLAFDLGVVRDMDFTEVDSNLPTPLSDRRDVVATRGGLKI